MDLHQIAREAVGAHAPCCFEKFGQRCNCGRGEIYERVVAILSAQRTSRVVDEERWTRLEQARADAAERRCAALEEGVQQALLAINPPDRGGISLYEWNNRLKIVSGRLRALMEQLNEETNGDVHHRQAEDR